MKVLVCGGRNFTDGARLRAVLNALHAKHVISAIVHGGAAGADSLAGIWAEEHHVQEFRVKANWKEYGKAAGAIRNQAMLERHKPDIVVQFPGGTGTADMVRRATLWGLTVIKG